MIAIQKGKDVEFTSEGRTGILKDCNALKLMATLYNKSGEKYSMKEMQNWGFFLK